MIIFTHNNLTENLVHIQSLKFSLENEVFGYGYCCAQQKTSRVILWRLIYVDFTHDSERLLLECSFIHRSPFYELLPQLNGKWFCSFKEIIITFVYDFVKVFREWRSIFPSDDVSWNSRKIIWPEASNPSIRYRDCNQPNEEELQLPILPIWE